MFKLRLLILSITAVRFHESERLVRDWQLVSGSTKSRYVWCRRWSMSKLSILFLFLIAFTPMMSGCHMELNSYTNLEAENVSNSLHLESSPPVAMAGVPAPIRFGDLDALLMAFAAERFDETSRFSPGLLGDINELLMPYNVPKDFTLSLIVFDGLSPSRFVEFDYNLLDAGILSQGATDAFFTWHHLLSNNSGSDAEFHFYREEWEDSPWLKYRWSQHGNEFSASINKEMTEKDIYGLINAFTNPQPLMAWEIQGNAISVSVQGMENVTIFGAEGHEIVNVATTEYNRSISRIRLDSSYRFIAHYDIHTIEHHSLYKSYGENLTRVGYSWLVDLETRRRQFVLEPGTYTFHVEGVIGEPDLLIRHFSDRDIVSSVSYGAELSSQGFSSFTVSVTSDYSGNSDTVEITLSND